MLNLVITCGGPYDMIYANRAINMFRRHYKKPTKAWCITERPNELDDGITAITPSITVTGWWNKVLTFGNDMPEGWLVVIDVDLIIINDITHIIDYAIENTKQMAAYSDAINWMDCKFSSSLMIFRQGTLSHIYDNFRLQWPSIKDFPGGDQVWTHPQLDHILYLDEQFPEFKKSLKFDLASIENNSFTVPKTLPAKTKIIDFHGRPKPHELTKWPIVAENWC
jgi:hypothetical protein